MTASGGRLERDYRRLLRCYPRSWRERREEEVVGLLMELAAVERRSTVGARTAIDLVGHGVEARLDGALRWLPWRLREQIAAVALMVVAGLSLLLLGGEIIAAQVRTASGEVFNYGYFTSGPFLTIGVVVYVGYIAAAVLCVSGRAGLARLAVLSTTAFAAFLHVDLGVPQPQLLIVVPLFMLGALAALATVVTTRRSARRLAGYGSAFVVSAAIALLATKPFLQWSLGTITTSGNVAFAALATALPFVCAAALVYASRTAARQPGWLIAIAVTIFPLIVFCTAVNQVITGPYRSEAILFTPLYYASVVFLLIIAHRQRRRPSTS